MVVVVGVTVGSMSWSERGTNVIYSTANIS